MVNAPNDSAPRVTLLLVYGSMAMAPLVYAVVAFMLRPPAAGAPLDLAALLADPLVMGLGMASLGAAVGGMVVPRLLVARLRASIADPRALSEDDRARLLRVPLTVRWSLFDAVGVCGFVLVFVGHPATLVVPFCGVALALLALHPPTASRLEGLLGE